MLIEQAEVVSIDEDGLWVATSSSSACGSCAAKAKGCGQSLIAEAQAGDKITVKAFFDERYPQAASRIWQAGDGAEIAVAEHALLQAAFALYLLPLLSMVAGVCLVAYFAAGAHELYSLGGAVLGFTLGVYVLRVYARRRGHDRAYRIIVV